jgi:hypothetical protein
MAVRQNGAALRHIEKTVSHSTAYINLSRTVVKKHGNWLQFVKNSQRTFELCMIAVQDEGLSLKHVISHMHTPENYYQLCMIAVQNDGDALKYVDTGVINYVEIAVAAVQQWSPAISHVNVQHPEFGTIALVAVRRDSRALNYIQLNVMNHETLIAMAMIAVHQDGQTIKFFDSLQSTSVYQQLCMNAVQQNWNALQFVVAEVLGNYRELCTVAIDQNGIALKYVNDDLLEPEIYYDLCMEAVRKDHRALNFMAKYLRTAEIIDLATI